MPDIAPSNEPSTKVDWSQITNVMPMTNSPNQVPSEAQVYLGDQAVYAQAKRTAYIGANQVDDVIAFQNTANTNASGIATFYLTDTRLSSGTALFTTVYDDTLVAMPYGTASNYQVTGYTISGDKKTVTVSVNQLGSAILGLVQITAAASGVPVKLSVFGK